MERKLDKRRRNYLILDCETATLPIAAKYAPADKKKISISKPLIYDLGWTICDRTGYTYRRRSYLVAEIFGNPELFRTAYYAEKRPAYLRSLANGEITVKPWSEIAAILESDMAEVDGVGAYNAMFDFKKAIPFTEFYIANVYGPHYDSWIAEQERICDDIVAGIRPTRQKTYEPDIFRFRNKIYPLFDIWGLACEHVLNCDWYKEKCAVNGWKTESGKYYKTSAETAFAFISGNPNFIESHTALEDAKIETEIFRAVCQRSRNKFEMGIIAFPFRILGTTE